jgi:CheY-like chemotaxis protein
MEALRILVVEDDAMVAMFLSMTLDQMGHDVCAVEATEAGAVKAAGSLRPDLLIVDVGLSSGDGVSAVAQILRAGPMPHIFASGDAEQVRARMPGAVVIQKPFQEADLARAIQRAMEAVATP